MDDQTRAEALARAFLRGDLSRRDFLRRSGGFSAGVLAATSLGSLAMSVCSWHRATSTADSTDASSPSS